jgi:hypothetical protein
MLTCGDEGMDLREALSQISEIREQVARTEVFRGYRAVPVAFSGVLALAVAAFQSAWLGDPSAHIEAYLAWWVGAALLSMAATAIEMLLDHKRRRSRLALQTAWLALGQFAPCVVAGGLLLVVLWVHARDALWMLPGLWALLFSLGIFASHRLLPRATIWVAAFYMAAAAVCLTLGPAALSPWTMGLPFGVGQLFAAGVLYWTLERNDAELQQEQP